MCDPISLVTSVVGLAASSMMKQSPKMPTAAEPTAPPQAAQRPDQQAMRSNAAGNAGGPRPTSAGNQGTQLTGPSGVSPDMLTLGKSTLLGA